MNTRTRRTPRLRRVGILLGTAVLAAAVGCAPKSDSTDSTPSSSNTSAGADACAKGSLSVKTAGKLTVGTDSPAYDPWFSGDDPTNGKGYESAVAYAIATKLGFSKDEVQWIKVPFNTSYQPGAKKFDFDINQISVTKKRAQAVTFSAPYYAAAQAVITLKKGKFASATSFADLEGAQFGAQVGTTSLEAIKQIGPSKEPRVYDDTNQATKALEVGQIDALVADLPSAYYITSAVLDKSTIVGQFQPQTGEKEEFALLLQKGDPLVTCLDPAIKSLTDDGSLEALEKQWLSQTTGVPELS